MYLQPYNYPHIHMRSNPHNFHITAPTVQQQQQPLHLLSTSQGSQLPLQPVRSSSPLQLQPVRSSSPLQLQADSRQRSASLNILSEQAPAQPAPRTFATNMAIAPEAAKHPPPPVIRLETDGEEERDGRSAAQYSDGSDGSDSTDFSFSDDLSDDLSSSEASFTQNLSVGARDEQLRLSRTPPPTATGYLSPTSGLEGKMVPSVSDPNLYKGPAAPKVPPRPRAQEILTRCTTITRKKANRASPSPAQIIC